MAVRKNGVRNTFWDHVAISEDENACWEWQRARFPTGYGHIRTTEHGDEYAHRLAYELATGTRPNGQHILHTCDNPPCCNPRHLFAGTALDNVADRDAKGRQARGSRSARAKLREEDIPVIRELRAQGLTLKAIADRFGVSYVAIHSVVQRRTWKHV